MFGIELQTSSNFFTDNVAEREVAYRTDDKTMTLEGDETTRPNAVSELEFVTSACNDLDSALKAVAHASALAKELATRAVQADRGIISFKAGDRLPGGQWRRSCTRRIEDPTFAAKPQGTVGVPLAGLGRLFDAAIDRSDESYWKDITALANSGIPLHDRSPEMAGFLTACHHFLVRA